MKNGALPAEAVEPKHTVYRRFLAFVGVVMDLSKVRIATMGGLGDEAEVWQEAGIPGNNGWLVERRSSRAARLIRSDLPYRMTGSLASLPRAFAAVHGSGVGLDAFHLDLCGMVETQSEAFRPVLDHLLKAGGARCLAVTVADARRNTSLERFRDVWYESFRLIGANDAQPFMAQLKAEQAAMPASSAAAHQGRLNVKKAAQREFALFVTLAGLLKDLAFVPDRVERYAFVSRTSGSPFRMRTYLFRFVPAEGDALERAQLFAQRWRESPLSFLTATGAVPVCITLPAPAPALKKETPVSQKPDPYPKLRALLALVGGEALAEFASLEKAAASAVDPKALAAVTQELESLKGKLRAILSEAVVPATVPAPPPAVGSRTRAPRPAQAAEVPALERTIEAQMTMLRAAAQSPEKLEEVKPTVRDMLGLKRAKNAGNRIGGLYARTQGKHRGNFTKRLFAATPAEKRQAVATELAATYTKITGVPVTPEQILKESASV